MQDKVASELIIKLELQPHPEGGFYKEFYKSKKYIETKDREGGTRPSSTSIYYLLESEDFSAWHRLKSDEIWHHYTGSSLIIHVITQSGELQHRLLGDPRIDLGFAFQIVVERNQWFSVSVKDVNSFALVGCTVSPGFDFRDFELAHEEGLKKDFPEHADIISRLTRKKEKNYHLKKNDFISVTKKKYNSGDDDDRKNNPSKRGWRIM